jgi:hypothetical protein
MTVPQLTHKNLLNNALSIGRCMHLGSTDVVCKCISTTINSVTYPNKFFIAGNVPPLFHCFDEYLHFIA